MDNQMPVCSGIEATKRIVKREGGHAIPKVIFLTAHVAPSFKEMCLESGAWGYLEKPCSADGLKAKLEEALADQ
jgi:CheY-like chemotaxis protein